MTLTDWYYISLDYGTEKRIEKVKSTSKITIFLPFSGRTNFGEPGIFLILGRTYFGEWPKKSILVGTKFGEFLDRSPISPKLVLAKNKFP